MVTAHEGVGRGERTDTLRWAADGELRLCDCELCWAHEPFWRYAALLAGQAQRSRRDASRAALACGIWDALSAGRCRRLRWRLTRPGLRRAVLALREIGRGEGWNEAQLYEAVLRGVSRNWERERG